jgi:TM2 domain-containing membrane protein YozV
MARYPLQRQDSAGGAAAGAAYTASAAWPAQSTADPRMRGAATGTMAGPGGKLYAVGKNPAVALILSLVIPGVGQFYNGDNKKGAIILGGYFVSWILAAAVIGFVGVVGFWIWGMIDAYNVASGKSPLM